MRRTLIMGAALVALGWRLPAHASSMQTRTYVGSVLDISTSAHCDGTSDLTGASGQGSVCFTVDTNKSLVDLTISDDVFAAYVPALFTFYDAAGNALGVPEGGVVSGGFCDAVVGVEIPQGSKFLRVGFPNGISRYPACPMNATMGTITGVFR